MAAYTKEIFGGEEILNWIDTEVKKSPYVDIVVHRLHQADDNKVHITYKVSERLKINCQYMYRHLALQEVNFN